MSTHVQVVFAAACALAALACETGNAPTAPTSPATAAPSDTSRQPSAGSSIRIIQGAITFHGPANFEVKGTDGFRFEGIAGMQEPVTSALFSPSCGAGCDPTQTVPFEHSWSGSDFGADAVLRGTPYPAVGGPVSESTAVMTVSGALRFPPAGTTPATATSPFELNGAFILQGAGQRIPLSGSGEATWTLTWSPGEGTWYVQQVVFRFSARR